MSGGTGGSGGVGPRLELEIYLVKFLKIRKKNFFFSIGPPLGKNRSPAPGHLWYYFMGLAIELYYLPWVIGLQYYGWIWRRENACVSEELSDTNICNK